ncbi:MAG: hypothetical protein HY744_13310 [Deltaproteobacteria bacterium]|nr:hypothetical protein [Deltaproteobacteria bacterium]
MTKGCPPGAYALLYLGKCVPYQREVRPVAKPSATLYSNAGGPCVDATSSLNKSSDFYSLGAEVASSTFVEGVEMTE